MRSNASGATKDGRSLLAELRAQYWDFSASVPISIDAPPGWVSFAETAHDVFGLRYTWRRVEEPDGSLQKCVASIPQVIPARVSFQVRYQTGFVTAMRVNVDRLERVTLEFSRTAIDESAFDDLMPLVLGRDSASPKAFAVRQSARADRAPA